MLYNKNICLRNKLLQFILILPAILALSVPGQVKAESLKEDQCLVCHQENDALPEGYHDYDIHMQAEISCSGCHGGDPTKADFDEAKARSTGFRGVPSRKDMPEFCGRCHSDIQYMRKFQPRIPTDQEEQYYTSYHGKLLKQNDSKVAVCNDCHITHSILPAKDTRSAVYPLNVPKTCSRCHSDTEYMAGYKIPTDQFEKYANSVHGDALLERNDTGAPACNDCHGNHGAMPPGVASISHVCGLCHVNNLKYFSESTMGEVFSDEGLHACEECHGYHGVQKSFDEMVGVGEGSTCTGCHSEGDLGYQVADSIYTEVSTLRASNDSVRTVLQEVKRIGMDDVEIGFMLQDAHQDLIQARTLVHTFDIAKVKEKTTAGTEKSKEALILAKSAIHEYGVRRRGFGIATIFITILSIALFFKIREMEKK